MSSCNLWSAVIARLPATAPADSSVWDGRWSGGQEVSLELTLAWTWSTVALPHCLIAIVERGLGKE